MAGPLRVISLDRTPQRFEQFRIWNRGLDIVRIPAVEGSLLDRAELLRQGLITDGCRYSAGALGNALSHIRLWQECAAGDAPFHIAEDDVILRADFHAMSAALLQSLPEWDIVMWTHNLDWPVKLRPGPGFGAATMQYEPGEGAQDHDTFRNATVMPVLPRLYSAAGTGCYSVSPQGAARMLADCLPLSGKPASYSPRPDVAWQNGGIDVEMCRHYENWRAHVALPPLAFAPNDMEASTIRGHLAALHSAHIVTPT
jgi:GR25 family glycosyltransferase involved in LPS biosynthesis